MDLKVRYRDYVQKLIVESVGFFARPPSSDLGTFKHGFHVAHSLWMDMVGSERDIVPMSDQLIEALVDLFDLAERYFRIIVASSVPYGAITKRQAPMWGELQKKAHRIMKGNEMLKNHYDLQE